MVFVDDLIICNPNTSVQTPEFAYLYIGMNMTEPKYYACLDWIWIILQFY